MVQQDARCSYTGILYAHHGCCLTWSIQNAVQHAQIDNVQGQRRGGIGTDEVEEFATFELAMRL